MPANYVLLERIELNASAASVTFANIPQTGYTDLKIVASARSSNTDGFTGTMSMRLNGNSGANYSFRQLFAATATPGSGNGSGQTYASVGGTVGASLTANTFNNAEIYLPNYTSSANKSWSLDTVSENNASTDFTYQLMLNAGLWSQTAAINEVTLFSGVTGSTNFVSGSTFSLYGLAAVGTTPVIAPKASGGSIYNDGTYWYHAFRTSGTFTPQTSLSCDALVVAGGGGGGGSTGAGGGGAGGLLYFANQSFSSSQSVTVGAGGAGSTTTDGTNGTDSQVGALTLVKGGGGGGGANQTAPRPGLTGGSGGGGSSGNTGNNPGAGGSATSGQGNAGGASTNSSGGGGGGAGAAGATGTTGVGGIGINTYSAFATATASGDSGYYAGGAGGSWYPGTSDHLGGTGGGGKGGRYGISGGSSGTVNTGGGGGGGDNSAYSGGSGIVIIRYTIA
jgi:hypothetical protein